MSGYILGGTCGDVACVRMGYAEASVSCDTNGLVPFATGVCGVLTTVIVACESWGSNRIPVYAWARVVLRRVSIYYTRTLACIYSEYVFSVNMGLVAKRHWCVLKGGRISWCCNRDACPWHLRYGCRYPGC